MAGSGVRAKYHVAIDSKGFVLRGTPAHPSYRKEEPHSTANIVALSDQQYDQLTGAGWRYWAQTDWSGGFQVLKWEDKGSFRDGRAVDVLKEYGKVTLQPGMPSAAVISGSHSFGAGAVHGNDLLLGTVKAGGAKVFKLTSASTLSTLSAMLGISAVNDMTRFGDNTLIGLSRTSGTAKTLVKYTGSAISGFRSTSKEVRAVKAIGIRAYIAELDAATSGDKLLYATNLSAFTSAYAAGKNRKIKKIQDLNGAPYFLVEEGNKVELNRFDEFTNRGYPVYTFQDLSSWGVTSYVSYIIITGVSNGKKVAYAFNGARLWQIFTDQLADSTYDFRYPFEFNGNMQTKGAQWDGEFWVPGIYGKFGAIQYTPFINAYNRAYGFAVSGTRLGIGYTSPTTFQISGQVDSSQFGGENGGVDKLVNSVEVNVEPLATGEMLEIFRSVDGGVNYSSVGTLKKSTDGAISHKRLYFPSGFVTKLWDYRAVLVGPGTTTPTLLDIAFQYRAIPDSKRLWTLNIDASDEVALLNNQREQRDGKALMASLWMQRDTKRTVVFEDVDAFSVNLVSAMTSAMTSARVKDVRSMPPQGRMRVVKAGAIEEMTYTSANGGYVKGISRAQRGTIAGSYTSAHTIDNFYSVIVTRIAQQLLTTDESKTENLAQVTLLEV